MRRRWSPAPPNSRTARSQSTTVVRSGCTRSLLLLHVLLVLMGLFAVPCPATAETNAVPLPGPIRSGPLVWDATVREASAEPMAKFVLFTFPFTNASDRIVSILNVQTSCECTAAELPPLPWTIAPGAGGTIQVRMNVVGRFGKVTKLVAVETSHGTQELSVTARIPITPAPFNVSARKMDLEAARKDPQTVFQGKCAACHSLPTVGRHGKDLFTKACAICHIAEHRAEMVPDLAALAPRPDPAYWRNLVVNGKPGTLMPAFSKAKGGPLEPDQVDSLVEYLVEAYATAPARPAASKD